MNFEEFNAPWKPLANQKEKPEEGSIIKQEQQPEYIVIVLSTVHLKNSKLPKT